MKIKHHFSNIHSFILLNGNPQLIISIVSTITIVVCVLSIVSDAVDVFKHCLFGPFWPQEAPK